MVGKKFSLILFIVGFLSTAISQVPHFDQFKKTVENAPVDSLQSAFENRIRLLNEQAESPLLLYETLEYQEAYGDSIGNQALSASAALELTKFETYHPKTKQFDYLLKAGNYENKLGNFDVGTNLHYQALDIAENLNNDTLRAKIFFRIGISFMKADNIPIAQKYLQSAIDVNTRLRDTVKLSGSYMSYGNSYKNSGVYDSALFYYQKSLDLAEIVGSVRNKAGNYNNMGNVYRIQGNYKSAINYYKKAVELNKETGNKTWLSYNYNNLGVTYLAMKQYNKALKYYQESLLIKEELGDHASKISTYENIAEIFYLKRNYRLAYENLQKAEDFKAQYQNEEKLNFTASLEAKFQNEKKEALLKQLKAEQELQAITLAAQQKKLALQDEIKAERNKMMIILLVIIISLLFALILFWRNANQKKQYVQTLHKKNNQIRSVNNDLSKAQMVLMKKNNEITDSITYAKRIQAAILPSQKLLKSTLENAFVMYLPKDIVAGDFYWTEQVNDKVLFAVADCTGHGVPGAMVSVICNSALNASIKNEGLSTPGEILDHTTEIVLKQFSKAEEDVKDGMDIALCSYHKESRILEYAGANIPLWLLRDGKVIEIKATRRPVGKHVIQQAFQTHKIEIKANDIIYLSSDGFADQFGGRRNKKYMKKNFKKLLVDVSEKSIAKQNELINTVFIDWKAENEQVDDICVMGIRFN